MNRLDPFQVVNEGLPPDKQVSPTQARENACVAEIQQVAAKYGCAIVGFALVDSVGHVQVQVRVVAKD